MPIYICEKARSVYNRIFLRNFRLLKMTHFAFSIFYFLNSFNDRFNYYINIYTQVIILLHPRKLVY